MAEPVCNPVSCSQAPLAAGHDTEDAEHTSVATANHFLSSALADFDDALNRRAFMPELQMLDREVERARRELAAVERRVGGRLHVASADGDPPTGS